MLRLNNGEAALFRGAEFADVDDILDLSRLAGSGPLLVLTANRVKSLGRSLRKIGQLQQLPLLTTSLSTKYLNLFLATRILTTMMILTSLRNEAGSLADHATRLLRNSKLLPAALLARLPFRDIAAQDRFALEHNISCS